MKELNKLIEFGNRIEQNSEEILQQASRFYIPFPRRMPLIVFLLVLFAVLFTKAAKNKTKQSKTKQNKIQNYFTTKKIQASKLLRKSAAVARTDRTFR